MLLLWVNYKTHHYLHPSLISEIQTQELSSTWTSMSISGTAIKQTVQSVNENDTWMKTFISSEAQKTWIDKQTKYIKQMFQKSDE